MEYRITKPLLQWCRRFVDGYFDPGCCLTLDELAERIYSNAGLPGVASLPPIPTPSSPFFANLPSYLAWNKNPQCPPKTWNEMMVPLEGKYSTATKPTSYSCLYLTYEKFIKNNYDLTPKSGTKNWEEKNSHGWKRDNKDGCLIVTRHKPYLITIDDADYVENYCTYLDSLIAFEGPKKDTRKGFWLINDQDSPFVYAILKSSMFRAWCELTANTTNRAGDFTTGMWDTFPLPDIKQAFKQTTVTPNFNGPTPTTIKMAISEAGKLLKTGKLNQTQLDDFIDELFIGKPISSTNPDPKKVQELRKKILAEGFLDAFYGA
ncbi:MAG: hypothetical protein IKT06_02240 [Aeriscardovia sp.]|nr:hypothetical protein [Aeriscardovia sp.]